MATEAATFRGADAVAAGLADEVTDLTRGFASFRQMLAATPILSPMRNRRAFLPQPRQEALMTHENHSDDSPQVADTDVTDNADGETDGADALPSAPTPAPAAAQPPVAAAPAAVPVAAQPSNLAELSAQLREAAAEIAEIAAQAGRLGIAIDAAQALREGTAPEALRRLVLERASVAADARDIVVAAPSPILPKSVESPIVAAAKRAASAGARS
jgi:hypothetical protein